MSTKKEKPAKPTKPNDGLHGEAVQVQPQDYTSGESEYDNNRTDFMQLKPEDKKEHIRDLWRQCFLKTIGGLTIKNFFDKLYRRIQLYGTNKNINKSREDIERKILEQKSKIVFLPDDAFKRFWNILMIFLLIYVATYVPYGICFVQKEEGAPLTTAEIIDFVVDAMFLIDIFVNFVSAYEDDETGLPIVNLRSIAIHYLSTWFFLDFLAVLPV